MDVQIHIMQQLLMTCRYAQMIDLNAAKPARLQGRDSSHAHALRDHG
ncbi:MAG: hypothetical protein ACLR07_04610 [Christensenellales bacterium]